LAVFDDTAFITSGLSQKIQSMITEGNTFKLECMQQFRTMAYERWVQEVHRTRAREDESKHIKFFCN